MSRSEQLTFQDAVQLSSPAMFNLMLKPIGSACNLDCSYCYYLDKAMQYGGREPVMDDELLERCIRECIAANTAGQASFCWHGGEPLLLGVDFFRRAVALQKRYAEGRQISNTIQTNGLLIDAEWCDFFAENDFLVGLSLDGPRDVHDAFRRTRGGEGTFDRVMRAVGQMLERGVEFNTLSVVNSLSEGRGAEIYAFLRDAGSRFMQFLPAVERVVDHPQSRRPVIVAPGTPGSRPAEWSVSAEGYGRFLTDVFDVWVTGDVGTCFVQMFDATLAGWCGVQPGICTMCETCGDELVVEHNGDVYPCDHFVYPERKLGNIRERSLSDLYASSVRIAFGLDKRNALPRECLQCEYGFACHGECPKHRFEKGRDGRPLNALCAGLQYYFRHVEPYMDYMRGLLEQGLPASGVMPWARRRMGLEL